VKLIKIAETLKISKKHIFEHIVHENFDMQMLCAKWLPRLLTIDQNQQRVDDLIQCLAIFNRNKDEFFRQYITMDVTWLLHNTPDSNQQSADWTEREEPNPKHGKDTKVSWHQYYGMGMGVVLYSSITSKRARPSPTSTTYRYWSVKR
jgi:hypothetical protein